MLPNFNYKYNMENKVTLHCIKEGSKLRVKIISPGYLNTANVQFPRDMRIEGRYFELPASCITLINTRGKYFYSATKRNLIKVIETPTATASQQLPTTIYEDTETMDCAICLCETKSIVFNPCGHYYVCSSCAYKITACPICRAEIISRISKELIQ